jgi:hypothetical protein
LFAEALGEGRGGGAVAGPEVLGVGGGDGGRVVFGPEALDGLSEVEDFFFFFFLGCFFFILR